MAVPDDVPDWERRIRESTRGNASVTRLIETLKVVGIEIVRAIREGNEPEETAPKPPPDHNWLEQDSLRTVRPSRAQVILFKPTGKYYTEEEWLIPNGAIGPYDMADSVDYHTLGGPVLVVTQEPWGYPHLLMPKEDS